MKSDNLFNFSSITKQLQEICELEDKLFAISDENYEEISRIFQNLSCDLNDFAHNLVLTVASFRPFQYNALANIWKILRYSILHYPWSNFWFYLVHNEIESYDEVNEKSIYQQYLDSFNRSNEDQIKNAIIAGDLEKVVFFSAEPDFFKRSINLASYDISLLEFSAFCGNAQIFKYLMMNGANLTQYIANQAVAGGNIEIIELCRSNGITFENSFSTSVKYHRNEIAKWIYEQYSPEISENDIREFIYSFNTSAFYFFYENLPKEKKHLKEYIDAIIEKGQILLLKYYYEPYLSFADPEKGTLLGLAAKYYSKPIIDFLLAKSEEYLNEKALDGKTPIFEAIEGTLVESVEYLISYGAECNVKDVYGYTPLYYAVKGNQMKIVETLLNHGVDVNEIYPRGMTPIMIAFPHFEITKYLIEKGANIHQKDTSNMTVLMKCVIDGTYDITKLLLEKGADVNQKDDNQNTALHYASMGNDPNIIELLLSYHADIEARNNHQKTPLLVAASTKFTQTAKALIQGNADINAVDNEGRTALILAAMNQKSDMFKYLKTCGGNKAAIDNYGKTAYDYQRTARIRN